MARRLVDLSIPITNDIISDPEQMRPQVTYSRHADTVPQMAAYFPGLTAGDLPDGEGWAVERVTLSTHNGTHMDAPWHFHSTTDQATGVRAAPSIDEGPLEYFLQPGVKLDFRHFPDGYVATAADVEAELARIGHTLQPLDIVLVNTAAGAAYGDPDFIHRGCGMGEEATLYLTERGVKVVGTDAWSWDAPFSHTAKRWAEKRDPKIIWEGHKAGRLREYYQIEKLTNLAALPANGFTLSCFPVKIAGASAGWIRAVAILDS
jgi:kynurenine formamidase